MTVGAGREGSGCKYHVSTAVLPSAELPIAHPLSVVPVGPKLISWNPFQQLLREEEEAGCLQGMKEPAGSTFLPLAGSERHGHVFQLY